MAVSPEALERGPLEHEEPTPLAFFLDGYAPGKLEILISIRKKEDDSGETERILEMSKPKFGGFISGRPSEIITHVATEQEVEETREWLVRYKEWHEKHVFPIRRVNTIVVGWGLKALDHALLQTVEEK